MITMQSYKTSLDWVGAQHARMLKHIQTWANINTGSSNIPGLQQFASLLHSSFGSLGKCQLHELPKRLVINEQGEKKMEPTGPALTVERKASGMRKVLLSGHMDTVFSPDSPFQKCHFDGVNKLVGPGVIDLKGGLVIMLTALQALERSSFAGRLAWEVVLNPDEEVGSISSAPLLTRRAKDCSIGLVFEPPYPNGHLVSARKGSAVYALVVIGKAAHAGRAFAEGINAIAVLAKLLSQIHQLNQDPNQAILNLGTIHGGAAANIVADKATATVGIRATTAEHMQLLEEKIFSLVADANKEGPATVILHHLSRRMPKPFDQATEHLFTCLQHCGQELGQELQWRSSGGVCDGNTLSAAGLANIDTLGAPGGGIHTEEEYLLISELVPRAQLVTLYLLSLANREWEPQRKEGAPAT